MHAGSALSDAPRRGTLNVKEVRCQPVAANLCQHLGQCRADGHDERE